MIPITKEEKQKLEMLYPQYQYPRTMKQDSKRHHYYCTESEELMRAIADSNFRAAERVKEFDKRRALNNARKKSRDRKGERNAS